MHKAFAHTFHDALAALFHHWYSLGAEFEARILASEANNVKFNFLQPTDPYHAYYRMRVSNRVLF